MAASRDNIVLIGMPGAGKSTVGVLLAKRLGLGFIDTDILIQQREGRSLQALIAAHGAEAFCRIEEGHLLSLALASHVIAPGGSVVYSSKAMAHLKAGGCVVHLDITVEQLKRRLHDVDGRGVVIAPGQTIDGLYAHRRPLYLAYADATVRTDGVTPEEAVRAVISAVTRWGHPPASPAR
ncbi:MAG: shikimate kinase [Desulfobacterales bacterium]|jgi:shikimate kinase|nr:shikimate kinase [Desulfobacterales bacterium]